MGGENGDKPHGDALHVPRWMLALIVPMLAVLGGVARTEYRTNLNERATERLTERVEMIRQMKADAEREQERRFSDLERTVQWLCAQRARDDAESGRTGAGPCP